MPRSTKTTARARQRDATRERIVHAALEEFADKGFRGASTRDVARRARTTQGLVTYHFRSKDALWRAAVTQVFGLLETRLAERAAAFEGDDLRERVRAGIREYVRFAAAHPGLFRIMVDAGNHSDTRMRWLVDTHVRPRFEVLKRSGVTAALGLNDTLLPHAFYALAGAASLVFAVAPECRRLTGLDPRSEKAIEAHAAYLAELLVA